MERAYTSKQACKGQQERKNTWGQESLEEEAMKKQWWIISLIILAIIWLPTGDPSDIITFGLITSLGINKYLFITAILILLIWVFVKGDNANEKFRNIKIIFKGR